jgi:hypothetical protein
MKYDRGGAELRLAGKPLGRIESGTARLVTDMSGVPRELGSISEQPQTVTLRLAGRALQKVTLKANARVEFGRL